MWTLVGPLPSEYKEARGFILSHTERLTSGCGTDPSVSRRARPSLPRVGICPPPSGGAPRSGPIVYPRSGSSHHSKASMPAPPIVIDLIGVVDPVIELIGSAPTPDRDDRHPSAFRFALREMYDVAH